MRVSLVPELPGAELARLELAGKAGPAPVAGAATDAAGIFRLVAPDAGMWRVRVESPGFAPLEAALLPLAEETELPDLRLVPGADLQVKVTDPGGRPVAGAWVGLGNPRLASRANDPWQPPARRVAFTDASGTATLPRSREEVLTLRAAAPGFLVAERKNFRGASAALRLAAGPARQLAVRDPQGKPVAGAFVRLPESDWLAGRTPESGRLDLAVPAAGVDLQIATEDGRWLVYRLRPAKPEEQGPAVAVLKPAAPVSGKVVSARDGRPVPGALAWLDIDTATVARAGTDGTFRLPNLPEGERAVFAAAPGFIDAYSQTTGGRLPTLALEPRLRAGGVVVDEAGRPVAGARLKATLLPGVGLSRGPAVYGTGGFARSNGSGRFQLTNLAAGAAYELRTEREGLAPARQELPAREPGAQAPELRIVLRAGRTAFGVVVDAGRRPLAGAQASLQPAAAADPIAHLRASRGKPERYSAPPTGADGRFELRDLPAGTFDLVIRGRGFAPLTVPALAIPEGKGATDLGTVALAAGAALRGLVVDAQGHPVEGAEVRAKAAQRESFPPPLSFDPGPVDAVSGADGAFVLEDRSPGESLDLTVSRPGYGPGSAPGVAVPREAPVRIVLQATSRVSGRAVDPDGKPVAGASVSVSEEEPTSRGGRSHQRWTGRTHSGVTDDEGGFAFDGVSPGPISLSARAPRRQETELRNLEVKAGQDLTNVEVVLAPGATVEGRVLSPEGRPVPGAEVSVAQPSQDNFGWSSLRATADGDGQYRIDGIPPGKRTLEARAEGYRRGVREVEASARAATVDFELERGLEVSGRIVDDGGNPVPGAQLMLMAGRGFSLNAPRAQSGADGAFRLTGLQDGTYTLHVNKEGYTAADFKGQMVTLAGASVSGLEVRLSGGGTITGHLTGVEFSQLSRVRVWAQMEFWAGRVDPEGNYQISHLPPGDWTVTAVVPDTPLHAEGQVTLEPGAPEARLDLNLGGGHTLTGVVLSNGQPLAGASLVLSRRKPVTRQSVVSDHEGSFRFGGLEDGGYDLDVATPKGARHHESLELAGDQTIRVELRTASLSGRVIDAEDSSPVSGAAITLAAAREEGLPSYPFSDVTTDARGAFRVPEVGDGAWKLKTTRDGYAPDERQVRVDGASPEEIEVRLKPTQGVTVEALLATGQPPERIRVAALDGNGRAVSTGVFPTGENGRTRISNVPPGSWLLLVEADPSAPVTLSAAVPGPAVRAVLPPAGQVHIEVPVLAKDSMEAKAVLSGPGGVYRDFDWDGSVKSEWDCHGGRVNLTRVPAGVWQVAVRAADGRTWSGTVTVTPGGVAEVGLK
ncbi:MAG: carboxypeptidase regulatory-like domain-containing protein [Thermoanaerobaculia bacterium]